MLTRELASKVALLIGSAEKQATAIPRLTLHQRMAPTPACHVTYDPSVIVVPQGRKEVQIGADTITYDSSRYLLTSIDMPAVTRVAEASEEKPCLAISLKFDISIVREFLSREEFHGFEAAPDSPALSIVPVTADFLSAIRRSALLTTEESKGVRMQFGKNGLKLTSRSPEAGEAEVNFPCKFEGGDVEIGFNPNFLTEALRVVDTDEISLELTAPNRPGLVRGGANFLYVIMPVNLQ